MARRMPIDDRLNIAPNIPPPYKKLITLLENARNDLLCPICFNYFLEPRLTPCGHTFCNDCITNALEVSNAKCPKCNTILKKPVVLIPNYVVNELSRKEEVKREEESRNQSKANMNFTHQIRKLLYEDNPECINSSQITLAIDFLKNTLDTVEDNSYVYAQSITKEFLNQLKRKKEEEIKRISSEIDIINKDLESIERNLINNSSSVKRKGKRPLSQKDVPILNRADDILSTSINKKRKIIMETHFDDFVERYFEDYQLELNLNDSSTIQDSLPSTSNKEISKNSNNLDSFTKALTQATRYNILKSKGTLTFSTDIFNSTNIVSAIKFNKDQTLFGIAGTTRMIKVYNFQTLVQEYVSLHHPVKEFNCTSKVACVDWNSYFTTLLASSNYEGGVVVWDINSGIRKHVFQEHEKRCWSVNFSKSDPKLLVSGSDDGKVKLWTTNSPKSLLSIEGNGNVCSVNFNPDNSYGVAFGSSNKVVYYYDLRNIEKPLNVFSGHSRAVSYVQFLNGKNLVSASTDGKLKLWDLNSQRCERTYSGHVNEKNFVGMDTDDNFIACGSETNEVYIYHVNLSKPLFKYNFGFLQTLAEGEPRENEEGHEFVSSLCWKRGSNFILAANSQGAVKLLEMNINGND